MSEGILSLGTCISVAAGSPTANTDTAFALLTWSASGEVTNNGEVGVENEVVSFTTTCDGIVNKRPGSSDWGGQDLEIAFDVDNAAQVILKAASISKATVSFKIVLSDTTIYYYDGYITSYKTRIGSASDVLMVNCTTVLKNPLVVA